MNTVKIAVKLASGKVVIFETPDYDAVARFLRMTNESVLQVWVMRDDGRAYLVA